VRKIVAIKLKNIKLIERFVVLPLLSGPLLTGILLIQMILKLLKSAEALSHRSERDREKWGEIIDLSFPTSNLFG